MDGPDRSVGRTISNLSQLNADLIEEVFGLITQSNENMLIYQVQWVFIIPPSNSS
jgi:hypothetical protein